MRVEGWLKKFYAAIETARVKPFEWGTHDCVLWATSMADVIWGTDYYSQARDRFPYSTEEGAKAILGAQGGIAGLVEVFIGPPIPAAQLSTGDLVLVKTAPFHVPWETLAVHDGQKLLAPGTDGLRFIPVRYGAVGWLIR